MSNKRKGGKDMFDFKFDWNDTLLLDIEKVDNQHKELFRIGRDMEQLILTKCIDIDTNQLLNIVIDLREFVSYHFYEEEQLMIRVNYSRYDEHVRDHESYKKKIMDIDLPKLAISPFEELSKIKDDLQEWIFHHMIVEDKHMADEIKAKILEN